MSFISNAVVALLILFVPRAMVLLSKKYKVMGALGPVFLCYACGFLFSLILPERSAAMDIAEILVPIAIPLILFSTDLRSVRHLAKSTMVSFGLMMLSAAAAASIVFLIFRSKVPELEKYCGMMTGLYIGGTPNLIAIGAALGVDEAHIVLANASDVVVGGIYFLMLVTVVPAIVHRLLPPFGAGAEAQYDERFVASLSDSFLHEGEVFSAGSIIRRVPIILLGVLSLGLGAGLALLITGELNVMIIMLVVTTCGIGCSFIKKVRNAPGSYAAGQYLIYMFSVGIGLSFDLGAVDVRSLMFLAVFASAQFGAAILHLILAKIAGIDGDTAVITSTAGIFGPAFIVPVANALKNREVIIPGLICGILGYAVGNYLGIGLALLLGAL